MGNVGRRRPYIWTGYAGQCCDVCWMASRGRALAGLCLYLCSVLQQHSSGPFSCRVYRTLRCRSSVESPQASSVNEIVGQYRRCAGRWDSLSTQYSLDHYFDRGRWLNIWHYYCCTRFLMLLHCYRARTGNPATIEQQVQKKALKKPGGSYPEPER